MQILIICSLQASYPKYNSQRLHICTFFLFSLQGRPVIIRPPEDQVVVSGATVTFDCFAVARPLHSLTWYFISANGSNSTIGSVNGTEKNIVQSGKHIITDDDNSMSPGGYGRLLIRNVQFEDRGTYLCRAENSLDSDTASATLSVQGK